MSGAPMRDEAWALLKLLADGEWRDYEQTLRDLAALVAPGRAIRQWYGTRQSRDRIGTEPPDDEKIRSGARSMAVSTVNSLSRRYVEVETDEFGRKMRIRRRPGTMPGSPPQVQVTPEEKRRIVAGELEPPPAPPEPVDTVLLRKLVGEEVTGALKALLPELVASGVSQGVGQVFGDFEARLERFLLDRFAGLEVLMAQGRFNRERPREWRR